MTGWEGCLYLENGSTYLGEGFGAKKDSGGEAVFNTGMMGYQEIVTDPSYLKQIVVMTYPHIGNTGINPEDMESRGLFLSALAVREYCPEPSNWRAKQTLDSYLEAAGIPGISGIDTRDLTISLRNEGAQRAVIFPLESVPSQSSPGAYGKKLLESVPAMEGLELVSRVSCQEPYEFQPSADTASNPWVVVYDYGVKWNILRMWKTNGFRVLVVPYRFPHQEVLSRKPIAVSLSNGPGDPALVPDSVQEIQNLIGRLPIFAVCMGHQLLARALGCHTYKLKFGHHGVNHPVQDLRTGKILVTSQNHGFSVKAEDLKAKSIELTHISLNDRTVEGFISNKLRLTSVQFHPESKPGPQDASSLFTEFTRGFLQ